MSIIGYFIDLSDDNYGTYILHDSFVNTPPKVFTSLTPGNTYQCRLRAFNDIGLSDYSETIEVLLKPPAPVAAEETGVTTGGFTASWSASNGAASYLLYVYDNSSVVVPGYDGLSVAGLSQSVTLLTAGATYTYKVKAVNASGNSVFSNTITVVMIPSAPVATDATNRTVSSLTANWNAVFGAVSYLLYVYDNLGSPVSGYDGLSVAGTSQSVTGLTENSNYTYKVKAVNAGGTSDFSNTISTSTKQWVERIVAHDNSSGTNQIYIYNTDGSNKIRLTSNVFNDTSPVLVENAVYYVSDRHGSDRQPYKLDLETMIETRLKTNSFDVNNIHSEADHDTIYYSDNRDGSVDFELFKYVISTAAETKLTETASGTNDFQPVPGSDGNVYFTSDATTDAIKKVPKAGGSSTTLLSSGSYIVRTPRPNPSATHVAFQSEEFGVGAEEIMICTSAGASPTRFTNSAGRNIQASWNVAGDKVFFVSSRNGAFQIWSFTYPAAVEAQITSNSGFSISHPWVGRIQN